MAADQQAKEGASLRKGEIKVNGGYKSLPIPLSLWRLKTMNPAMVNSKKYLIMNPLFKHVFSLYPFARTVYQSI
jgi:hypothetical protein